MAASHGKSAVVYLGTTNLSGYAVNANLSIDIDTADTTTFADGAKTAVEGDFGFKFDIECLMDNTDGGITETTYAAAVTNMGIQYVLFAPAGATQGTEPVYELLCRWTAHPFNGSIGDVWRVAGSMIGSGTGSLSRGYVLQNEAVTATGAETGYNMGALSASSKLAIVTYRIVSIDGDMVWALEESQDNASADAYAAVAALASGTLNAAGVTRVTTSGALEAWRRVNVTNAPTTTATVLVTHTVAPNL